MFSRLLNNAYYALKKLQYEIFCIVFTSLNNNFIDFVRDNENKKILI